ncbi:hypothetical protein ACTFIU_007738 [Dictyostelium citrinum]
MKLTIKLFLSLLMINAVIGEEVRQLSFLNGNCEDLPYATYAHTLCSPESFSIINETTITIRSSTSFQDCKIKPDDPEQTGDTHNLNECMILSDSSFSDNYETIIDKNIVNNEDLNSLSSSSSSYEIPSFSLVYTYSKSRFPSMVKGYCNQIKLYDCDNYQIYSFKNDSCFSNTDTSSSYPYYKQICRGDSILTFKCEECTTNSLETCILDNTEPSNLSKCPNIKYTTIEKILNEIKYNNDDNKNSIKSIDDLKEENQESLLDKISIKKIEETKLPYTHIIEVENDKKGNSSSFLISNSILILILLILSLF